MQTLKNFIKDAMKLDSLTDQERLQLDFQLGLVFKAEGDTKKAVKIFKKIYDTDKSFKGVAKELNELL